MQTELPFDAPRPLPVAVDWKSQVPSVSQLTRRIRGHLENSFFDVWVKGEISNFRKPISGHAYFILKDAQAQLRTVMFKGQQQKLKFELKDGMEVLVHGTITVYETRGEYQLVCDTLEPSGMGALQLAFEQLKTRLQAEGLFDPAHKKKLPFIPKRIGVVTSPTGAAVRDILKVLHRRFPNLEVLVLPTSVQGERAAPEIVRMIETAHRWNELHSDRTLDVLIVGRGGGSIEDLWPFNEEIVARAVFKSSIPIISAVGHEIDFTICDFVADLRAPTPSAAAEIVTPNQAELRERITSMMHRVIHANWVCLRHIRLHLDHLCQRLVDPREKIRIIKEKVTALEDKLLQRMKTTLLLSKQRLEKFAVLLHSLSPLKVLSRGYSITSRIGNQATEIVRSVSEIQPGSHLHTRFKDGAVISEVLSLTDRLK